MSNPTILVTGATGKTGTVVVEQLLEKGFPVRALVRRRSDASDGLEALGADVVIGDLFDLESLRKALDGIDRAYFVPPVAERLLEATANFAVAAKETGLEAVVNVSQIISRPGHVSPQTREHWLAERTLDWAKVGAIHILPTLFAEMSLLFGAKTMAEEGRLYLPYGEGRHAPIAMADIARSAVAILAEPAPHIGQTYVLTGPESISIHEIAASFAEALGKPVSYVDIPTEAWGEQIAAMGEDPFLFVHLPAVAEDHRNGAFDAATDDVERITGRRAATIAEFARASAQALGA